MNMKMYSYKAPEKEHDKAVKKLLKETGLKSRGALIRKRLEIN